MRGRADRGYIENGSDSFTRLVMATSFKYCPLSEVSVKSGVAHSDPFMTPLRSFCYHDIIVKDSRALFLLRRLANTWLRDLPIVRPRSFPALGALLSASIVARLWVR